MLNFISYKENMLNGFTTNEILWELPRDYDGNKHNGTFMYLYNFAKDIEDMSEDKIKLYMDKYVNRDFTIETTKELVTKENKIRRITSIRINAGLVKIIYTFGYIS